MAFEAKIIRLITKSPGFSVYLCIMNINIKQCMYVKSQKKIELNYIIKENIKYMCGKIKGS